MTCNVQHLGLSREMTVKRESELERLHSENKCVWKNY